jgi:hypothetical protein
MKNLLSNVYIKEPCRMDWNKMAGDEKTRFCSECNLHVHNLSEMSSNEAERFLSAPKEGGRRCIAYFKDVKGKVLTRRSRWTAFLWRLCAGTVSLLFPLLANAETNACSNPTVGEPMPINKNLEQKGEEMMLGGITATYVETQQGKYVAVKPNSPRSTGTKPRPNVQKK